MSKIREFDERNGGIASKPLAVALGLETGAALGPYVVVVRKVAEMMDLPAEAIVRATATQEGKIWSAGDHLPEAIEAVEKAKVG